MFCEKILIRGVTQVIYLSNAAKVQHFLLFSHQIEITCGIWCSVFGIRHLMRYQHESNNLISGRRTSDMNIVRLQQQFELIRNIKMRGKSYKIRLLYGTFVKLDPIRRDFRVGSLPMSHEYRVTRSKFHYFSQFLISLLFARTEEKKIEPKHIHRNAFKS